MERSNFIKLLEEYRNRAIMELRKEANVQASLLLSDGFKSAITELEKSCTMVNSGLSKIAQEFKGIASDNKFPSHIRFYHNTATTNILDGVIGSIAEGIRENSTYKQKESEIRNKFDAAIRAAKTSRSAVRIKELADAVGIETPSIEVNSTVTAEVDTEFVKEKIQSVLLLK